MYYCHCLQAAVDALSCVEQAMAVAPLFAGARTDAVRPCRKSPEIRDTKEASFRRQLSYTDEDQGAIPLHTLR